MTGNLCNKYIEARETMKKAENYYIQISANVEQDTLQVWEHEVKHAEIHRMDDIAVMDIYTARLPTNLMGDIDSSGSASGSALALALALASTSAVDKWFEYAFMVEETQ